MHFLCQDSWIRKPPPILHMHLASGLRSRARCPEHLQLFIITWVKSENMCSFLCIGLYRSLLHIPINRAYAVESGHYVPARNFEFVIENTPSEALKKRGFPIWAVPTSEQNIAVSLNCPEEFPVLHGLARWFLDLDVSGSIV
jgi:hypothetical protein